MADERRSSRQDPSGGRGGRPNGAKASGGRGGAQRSTGGRSETGRRTGESPAKPGRPGGSRDGKPGTRGAASGGKPGARSSAGTGRYSSEKPYKDGKGRSKDDGARDGRRPATRRPDREIVERTADQRAYDGPDLPEDITGKELDRSIAAQLRGLPEKLANRVARHLVAAGTFIDDNPELAYQHAKAAKARTQRIAVIREALGEAAYAAGHYAEALAELRAAKRMNGATAYLPIMADCHRALGQPQQAIKLAHSPSVANFPVEAKAEMTIVEAGARRDMKQYDAALRILELAPLNNKSRAPWVVRLRYAYADTLDAAGRTSEALEWFHRTHAIDSDDLTDAEARAASLEKALSE